MLACVDSNIIWVRRNDWGKWTAFWAVSQFIRDLPSDQALRRTLFTGRFSELIGIRREVKLPSPSRTYVWFSGDATPSCIGGVNWATKEFVVDGPKEFLLPFFPWNRTKAHINETEFLTEIICTVLWGADRSDVVVCGVTDNASADMWYSKGRAKRGVGMRLARTFHRWLLERQFRTHSFYCRSEHNITADFLSRASVAELEEWST